MKGNKDTLKKGDFDYVDAVKQIKSAILQSRYMAARLANAEQLKLYFSIGAYVSANSRAGKWGTATIEAISKNLQAELPGLRGFSARSITYMRTFYEEWFAAARKDDSMHVIPTADVFLHLPSAKMPGAAIAALSGTTEAASSALQAFFTIGFTHHRYVIEACKQLNERWYYIKRCAAEFWTVEALKSHLKADDYHRYGSLPNNFALTFPDASQAAKAVRAFKDEYLLDYINIEESESLQDIDERVLNRTLVLKIKRFIQSLGHDFCFIADDYRLIVDDDEWFVDLLFFNRTMKCLVAIELKRGKFKPAYLGQLNYYLSVLDDKERHSDENPSIGLILCQEAKRGVVELAIRDFGKPMGVATYRLEQNVPENYKPLQPLVNGVQQILDKGAEDKISASK